MKSVFFLALLTIFTACSTTSHVATDSTRNPSSTLVWGTGAIAVSNQGGRGQLCGWAETAARDVAVGNCRAQGGRSSGYIQQKQSCHCSADECTMSVAVDCK